MWLGRARGGAARGLRAHVAGDLRALRGRPGAAAAARQRGADRPGRDVGGLRHRGMRRPQPGGRDARLGAGGASFAVGARLGPRARSAGAAQPLGLDRSRGHRRIESLDEEDGVLLYTDGILDARDAAGSVSARSGWASWSRHTPARRRRAWWSTCGSRSPTSPRPRATMSACSRRVTTPRDRGGGGAGRLREPDEQVEPLIASSCRPSPIPRRSRVTRSRGSTATSGPCSATSCW